MRTIEGRARIEAIQKLANYPLLERADGKDVEEIVGAAELVAAPAEEIVRVGGSNEQHVTFVLAGSVRVFHRIEDGREFTAKILIAPNHFGDLQQLAGGRAHVQSVEVVTDAILALVPFAVLDAALSRNGALCRPGSLVSRRSSSPPSTPIATTRSCRCPAASPTCCSRTPTCTAPPIAAASS